jgi:hypothetical protein
MKQLFGATPARSCLPSMPWIVANHYKEGAASISVAGKTCKPTDARTIDFRAPAFFTQSDDFKLCIEGVKYA